MPSCHNCGAEVNETAKFCMGCGCQLKGEPMAKVERVCDIEKVWSMMLDIGVSKCVLPLQLRGWMSAVGLYVQLRSAGGWQRLEAGGMFRSCFDALCRSPIPSMEFANWEIRKFDQRRWERHFAHLVWPTWEISLYLGSDAQDEATFMAVVEHFKKTGEWLGLRDLRCATCGKRVAIWQWQHESCPHCGGNLRQP